MILVRFQVERDGGVTTVHMRDMDAPPRVDDHVELPGDYFGRSVLGVTWALDANHVNVLLEGI